MTITAAHIPAIVALNCGDFDPDHAAAAQLHRSDLSDLRRPGRSRRAQDVSHSLARRKAGFRGLRGTPQSGVRRAIFSPFRIVGIHGQSRREVQEGCSEIYSEIKVIGPSQGRGRAVRPQGAEEGPGQAGRQQGGQEGCGPQAGRRDGKIRQVGLYLRRRQGRGQSGPARPARRQGRQPRRNGQSRPAGASGLHHSDLGLHLFLRPRQILSAPH